MVGLRDNLGTGAGTGDSFGGRGGAGSRAGASRPLRTTAKEPVRVDPFDNRLMGGSGMTSGMASGTASGSAVRAAPTTMISSPSLIGGLGGGPCIAR